MAFAAKEFYPEQLQRAAALFKNKTNFVLGAAKTNQLPTADRPEVAFAGRSNVGKSSLINALTGQKGLAKTSHTPGRTQQLNFFDLAGKLYLVDLPGYGYAQAPESQVKQWQSVIFAYLQGRPNLKRVFLLIDARHGIKKNDREIMDMLDKAAVTYQIILTKADKVGFDQLQQVLADTQAESSKHAAAYIHVLLTSSEKKTGIDILQAEIAHLAGEV